MRGRHSRRVTGRHGQSPHYRRGVVTIDYSTPDIFLLSARSTRIESPAILRADDILYYWPSLGYLTMPPHRTGLKNGARPRAMMILLEGQLASCAWCAKPTID